MAEGEIGLSMNSNIEGRGFCHFCMCEMTVCALLVLYHHGTCTVDVIQP
jgi:hypothetical protein